MADTAEKETPEVKVEDVEVILTPEQEAQEDADFASGFEDKPTAKPAKSETDEKTAEPDAKNEDKEIEAAVNAGDKPADAEKEVETKAEPKYVQITEDDFKRFNENSKTLDALKELTEKKFGTAFGKMGGIEQKLGQLASQTPSGQAVEITEEIVADVAKEYPELAKAQLSAFKKLAERMKGTGAPLPDFDGKVSAAVIALQIEALEDEHPDWRKLTGSKDEKTPYREWLAKRPADYQERIAATNSAAVLARSITLFQTEAAAAQAAADAIALKLKNKKPDRVAAIRDAVQPKGGGARVEEKPDADAEFEAGYNSK